MSRLTYLVAQVVVSVLAGEAGLAVRVERARPTHVLAVHGRLARRNVRHHHSGADALRRPRPDQNRQLNRR